MTPHLHRAGTGSGPTGAKLTDLNGKAPPLTVIPGLDPGINRRTALLVQIPGPSPGMTRVGC
jgi:hypothetical protein